jgi:hypothetical protein
MSKGKRPSAKQAKQPTENPEAIILIERGPGKGVKLCLDDQVILFPIDLLRRPWIGAIVMVDETKGVRKDPLLNLLRDPKQDIRELEWKYLADLLWRRQFPDSAALEKLRGPDEPTLADRLRLADKIDRCELKRPARRPTTPAYRMTEAEMPLAMAAERARWLQKQGGKPMSFKQALKKIEPNTERAHQLEAYMRGSIGGFRRQKNRRPK